MRKEALIVFVLVLGLVFAQGVIGEEEKLKVPFSAIKSGCYGEIDMSKAEFSLSEIGGECINEDWLKEHKSKQEGQTGKAENSMATKSKRAEVPEANIKIDHPPRVLTVPKSAIMEERRAKFSEEQQDKEEVEVSVSWIKNSWLADNRPELAKNAVLDLFGDQPSIEEVVQTINTPRQLRKFVNGYFSTGRPEGRDGVTPYSPSRMLEKKVGDCKDWATFISYMLKWNGYDAQKLVRPLNPVDDGHVIPIWKDHKGQYHLLNFTEFDWNAGDTIEEVITFLEDKNDRFNNVFYHALLDPLKLKMRRGTASAFAEACLEEVPHVKELDSDQFSLKGEKKEDNAFHGKMVKVKSLDNGKHLITFVVDLNKNFEKATPRYVLVDVVGSSNTVYMEYNWSTKEMEYKDFEEVVWVGEKGGFSAEEDTSIDQIDQYTARELWST